MTTKTKTAKATTDERKIIRTDRAGCFLATIESRSETQSGIGAVLRNSRRLWYWDGAATLSQLAKEGTRKPGECKFPASVDRQEVFGVIEILDTTEQARASIDGVPVWRA